MFKIFKRLTTKELIMIVLVVIFVCLNVYLNLKIPDYMSDITTLLSTKGTKASDIFAWNTDAPGMRMLLMSFAGFMASVVVGFLAARTAASFTTRLRDDIFHQVLDFSACNVADGIFEDETFLPILYELDSREEWTRPEMWQKANPALGTIKKLEDLQNKVIRAQNNPVDLKGILVKDFNIRDTIGNAWLSLEDITNKETFDLEQFRGCYAIGGADLSSSRDLTCATLLLIDRETEKRYVAQMYWIPEDSMERRVNEEKLPYDKWYERGLVRLCKGNTINYKDVTAWFVEMANTYGIFPAWIYYDRWSATYWVEEMKATGFTEMKGVAQGAKTLSLPMQFLGADLQAKKINYNNNPVLRWCLSNTGVQEDRNGNIVPIKNQAAKQRIDGTASLLNAYVGLYEHYNEFIEAQ